MFNLCTCYTPSITLLVTLVQTYMINFQTRQSNDVQINSQDSNLAKKYFCLAWYMKHCAKVGYGRTRRDVLCIVESTAKERGVLHSSHISGGWWHRFLERQADLFLKQGDSTALVRMDAKTRWTTTLACYMTHLQRMICWRSHLKSTMWMKVVSL